ncbi:HAD-IB family hydrolase [Corynebacterium anserum]
MRKQPEDSRQNDPRIPDVPPMVDAVDSSLSGALLTARSAARNFLSRFVFPTRGETAQREAGEASVKEALGSLSSPSPQSGTTSSLSSDATSAPSPGTTSSLSSDATSAPAVISPAVEDSPWETLDPDAPHDSEAIDELAASLNVDDEHLREGLRNIRGAAAAAGGANKLNPPDPAIPQEVGAAAFFDVDNTLIKGASILLLARGLVRRRFFTLREITDFAWKQLKFRLGGENQGDIDEGRDQALALVKGHRASELTELAEDIWARSISDRIFPGTKELADRHLKSGHQVWLVTAAPVQLAQIIARELGFTGALGTVAEVKNDVFTGRMVGDMLHGPGKKHAVVALSSYENLDLRRCTAYSDSINDVPMLSMVGTAVAVNPDSRLRKVAKKNGWEIRDYRRTMRVIRGVGRGAAWGVKRPARYAVRVSGRWIKRR